MLMLLVLLVMQSHVIVVYPKEVSLTSLPSSFSMYVPFPTFSSFLRFCCHVRIILIFHSRWLVFYVDKNVGQVAAPSVNMIFGCIPPTLPVPHLEYKHTHTHSLSLHLWIIFINFILLHLFCLLFCCVFCLSDWLSE
jgi:predicted Na+-dependent transporter